jgi:hypothetical protein
MEQNPTHFPETDLSIFPIVPPVATACANAVAPTARDAGIPNESIKTIRSPASFPPAVLRSPSQKPFDAAAAAVGQRAL